MSKITCWRCGFELNTTMFGGLQKCPSCRQVDAINKQTKQLAKMSPTNYSTNSQTNCPPPKPITFADLKKAGKGWFIILSLIAIYWVGSWLWQAISSIEPYFGNTTFWGVILAVVLGLSIWGNRKK